MSCELYQQVLGERWWALTELVRRAHEAGEERRGHFLVSNGDRWVAKRLARWSRLPRSANAAATRLKITVEGTAQLWERQFGSDAFTTKQWMGDGGRLVERFGAWELSFDLHVEQEALYYVQRCTRLCVGRLRLRLPPTCAPLVSASEASDGPDRVRVTVTVTLPLFGLLVGYDGFLELGALPQ